MIRYVLGNLLEMDGFLLHQCNCVTTKSRGLASKIFAKFPYANFYNKGIVRIPGNIYITGNVIGLLAQYHPGNTTLIETPEMRIQWFIQCLQNIQAYFSTYYYPNVILNFPYLIGCGLAGGDWGIYHQILINFSNANPTFIIRIVKLPPNYPD
jgi:hypothetical protein